MLETTASTKWSRTIPMLTCRAFVDIRSVRTAPPTTPPCSKYYTGGVSNDNQITATYQRRLTYGFTIQASYTWAHALDEISNGGSLNYSSYQPCLSVQPLNLRYNYGNADYDIRNSFNAQYVWNTPWKFGNKYVQGAIGGWTLSQNFFARSGLPMTVLDGYDSPGNFPSGGLLPATVVGIGQSGCGTITKLCLTLRLCCPHDYGDGFQPDA